MAFHFCLPPFDTFQHFDNFATRSLSGDYDVPVGEVTRQHLEKAKGEPPRRVAEPAELVMASAG